MVQTRVRPGVYFETAAREVRAPLPRMDIAALVGFAASGPLHRPVALESEADFSDVFGSDLKLPADPQTGWPTTASLRSSVGAFFRNGGRRCWVIRVADPETATTQLFQLPGLVAVDPSDGTSFVPAVARARSPGSWADGIRVSTHVQRRGLTVTRMTHSGGDLQIRITGLARSGLGEGDLLRLVLRTEDGTAECYAPLAEPVRAAGDELVLSLASDTCHWLMPANPDAVARLALANWQGGAEWVDVAQDDGGLEVNLPATCAAPQAGSALPALIDTGARRTPGIVIVEDVARTASSTSVRILPARVLVRVESPDDFSGVELLQVERLSFAIDVEDGDEGRFRLERLGFSATHPQFWGSIPDDAALYPDPSDPRPDARAGAQHDLAVKASSPRFPLAGPTGDGPVLYLPIGMAMRPNVVPALAAIGDSSSRTRLQRNGLGDASARLFVDPDLAERSAGSLRAVASDKRYRRNLGLRGLHAAFFLEDVTLLAAPDLARPDWQRSERTFTPDHPTEAPEANGLTPDRTGGLLNWTEVPDATGYVVESASDPAFEQGLLRWSVRDATALHMQAEGCPQCVWVRVRALDGAAGSPWSRTLADRLPRVDFAPDDESALDAPEFKPLPADATDQPTLSLQWSEVDRASRYRVQEAVEPLFAAPAEANVTGTSYRVRHGVDRIYYYRCRAEVVEHDGPPKVGPWSETLVAVPPASVDVTIEGVRGKVRLDIVAVHAAMLRLGMARGDIFSLLSLPPEADTALSIAHTDALETELGADAADGLSYGAVYKPWLIASGGSGPATHMPPDGPVAGMFARLALRRGAWIAPANRRLVDVVATQRDSTEADRRELFDRQINLVVPGRNGFRSMTADTLSRSENLRPANVRRLLMLLRRLADREGAKLVFEPNSESFRERLLLLLGGMMNDLFVRGAFAGERPSDAFRLVADESVNTPRDVDAGRLIVEMRVAPARPAEFLVVRLLQDRERNVLTTES